jgi:hypothetical protein
VLHCVWEILLLALLFGVAIKVAHAGVVRTIYVDSKTMSPIHLKLGESTLLRFNEKPKKVVIGNANYFNVEFVESDVTIQPLGRNSTNLFVYCENHTYGFLLDVGSQGYDDLVLVKWKGAGFMERTEKEQKPAMKTSNPKIILDLGKKLKVKIQKIQGPTLFGMHAVDMLIENDLPVDIKAKEVTVSLTTEDGAIYKGEWALDGDQIKAHSQIHARFLGKLDSKRNLLVTAKYLDIRSKALILKRFL